MIMIDINELFRKRLLKEHEVDRFDATSALPDFHFGIEETCTYCGEYADSVDHCIPWAMLHTANESKRRSLRGITTPSCMWCNQKLMDNFYPTFAERLTTVESFVIREAKKYTGVPSWADEDICKLDFTLRSYVSKVQNIIRKLDQMRTWRYSKGWYKCIHTLKNRPELDYSHPKYCSFLVEFFQDIL